MVSGTQIAIEGAGEGDRLPAGKGRGEVDHRRDADAAADHDRRPGLACGIGKLLPSGPMRLTLSPAVRALIHVVPVPTLRWMMSSSTLMRVSRRSAMEKGLRSSARGAGEFPAGDLDPLPGFPVEFLLDGVVEVQLVAAGDLHELARRGGREGWQAEGRADSDRVQSGRLERTSASNMRTGLVHDGRGFYRASR